MYNGIVYYSVFRTTAYAQAAIAKPIVGPTFTMHEIARSVPGFTSGTRFSGTVIASNEAGKAITETATEAAITDGDVAIQVLTVNAPQDELPVLRSAVAHLQSADRLATH